MSQKRKQLLLISAVLTSLLLAFVWSGFSGAGQVDLHARPSTFYSDRTGAKASYLVLEHFLPNLARIRKPFRFWVQEEKNQATTIVVQKPHLNISIGDAQALENWVYQGGRLIYVSYVPWIIETPPKNSYSKTAETAKDVTETLNRELSDASQAAPVKIEVEDKRKRFEVAGGEDLLERFGVTIYNESVDSKQTFGPLMLAPAHLEGAHVEPMITHQSKTIVGKVPYGVGEIIVVPDSLAFCNQRLFESENVHWLLQQCQQGGRAVFFDEYHQGFGRRTNIFGLIFRFLISPWGFAFLQLGLVGFLLFWGPWRRFGSVLNAPDHHRYNPMERIAARAALFKEAKAFDLAFQATHQYLARVLKHRHPTKSFFATNGNPGDESDIPTHPGLDRYREILQEAESGRGISEKDFLEASRLSGDIVKEI